MLRGFFRRLIGGKDVVIFDFDGVIIDSLKVVQDFDRWLYPGRSEEEWKETDRGNYFQKMAKYEHLRRKVSEEEINQKRLEFYSQKNESRIFPGVVELIVELSKEKVLAINTSSKYEGCANFLKKNKVFDWFSFLATKETATSKKEKFRIIFEKFKVDEMSCMFVTDTIGDLLEAQAIGIKTICVTWGIHKREDFMEYSPHAIVDTVEELSDYIM